LPRHADVCRETFV